MDESSWPPVTRTIAAVGIAAIAAGAATAAMAFARTREWASAEWFELLLTLSAVAALVTAGMLVVTVVTAGLLALVGAIVSPAQPPGLARIVRIMELHAAERDGGAAAADGAPPVAPHQNSSSLSA